MNEIYKNMIKALSANIKEDDIRSFISEMPDSEFMKYRKYANTVIDNETQRRGV